MLIGRNKELQQLQEAYNSSEAQLVAVYGRRRVGKTYLIRNAFNNSFFFTYTGVLNISTKEKIADFHSSMIRQGAPKSPTPKTWMEAFRNLMDYIDTSNNKRKVIFLDELPWMDAPRSTFLAALEHFWNGWAAARNDVMLIICGSASSWIINKIFRNKGGLHNRVTRKIHLHPFSLYEVEQYAIHLKLGLSRNQIIEGYMVMGGIPLYWSKMRKTRSLAQNINDLFFQESGEFRYEFNELYSSLFNNPEKYISIVKALSSKRGGLTRSEIIKSAKIENNGHFSEMLEELIECGFIRKYCHPDLKLKNAVYQLVDFYTIFYYRFIESAYVADDNYWVKLQNSNTYYNWCGLAFERVCLLHIRQIKEILGISGVMANIYSFYKSKTDEHPGVQIDLLIDRSDNVVNLVEMKYAADGYSLNKKEVDNLSTRRRVLAQYISPKKAIQFVLVTSNGLVTQPKDIDINWSITASQLFIP